MTIQLYVVFRNALAEYEWKVPASILNEKDAQRVFERTYPDLIFIRVIKREL